MRELGGRRKCSAKPNFGGDICPLKVTRGALQAETSSRRYRLRSYCVSWWFSRYASAGLQVCIRWLRWKMRRRLLAFRAKTQNEGGKFRHGPPKRNVEPGPSYTFPILIRKSGGQHSKHRGRLHYKNTAPPGNETNFPPSPRHANSFDPSKSPRVKSSYGGISTGLLMEQIFSI